MLCEKYAALSIHEAREYIGALLHACQSDQQCFELGAKIITLAQRKGVLDNVKILPEGWAETPSEKDGEA
jgi:hypothetical protein